jgi:hypothetical protein
MNPDGTVQVAPPTQSAFGPASASAPPPPMQAQPVQPVGHPGFSGAIQDLVAMLAKVLAPQRSQGHTFDAQNNQAVEDAQTGLGDELGAGRK